MAVRRAHLLVLLLLLGCHEQRGAAPHPLIVVLGSSTAAAAGLTDPSTSWVNRYAAAVSKDGVRVVNLAVGGYTTYQIQPTGTAGYARLC